MTTFNRVMSAKPPSLICGAMGCCAPAMGQRNGRHYCPDHIGGRRPSPVTIEVIASARADLRTGRDLKEVAIRLGVATAELDIALWRNIGAPVDAPFRGAV